MASTMKYLFRRSYLFCLRVLDRFLRSLGIKICRITYESILWGLTAEEAAEALDPTVEKPLTLCIEAADNTEAMDVVARLIFMERMRMTLRSRAAIKKTLRQQPDILQTRIERPIIIVGPPRTGTTLLFQLMAEDPQLVSPMLWELVFPCPPGRPENWRECSRYKKLKDILDFRIAADGDFNVAHELVAHHPEECVFALAKSFLTYHYAWRFKSFGKFDEWFLNLTKDEMVEVFRFHKKSLQMIFYKGLGQRRLVLKAHIHLLSLDALLEVFPDASLIFTYRRMTEVVPSACSMIDKGTRAWGKLDDEYGKRVLRHLAMFANRGVATMKRFSDNDTPFHNIRYTDLVENPLSVMRAIYKRQGLVFTAETEGRMRAWLAKNPQHKHGTHSYNLEKYGLTKEDIVSSMGPFLGYFGQKSEDLI